MIPSMIKRNECQMYPAEFRASIQSIVVSCILTQEAQRKKHQTIERPDPNHILRIATRLVLKSNSPLNSNSLDLGLIRQRLPTVLHRRARPKFAFRGTTYIVRRGSIGLIDGLMEKSPFVHGAIHWSCHCWVWDSGVVWLCYQSFFLFELNFILCIRSRCPRDVILSSFEL